jgi:hypothetical protein
MINLRGDQPPAAEVPAQPTSESLTLQSARWDAGLGIGTAPPDAVTGPWPDLSLIDYPILIINNFVIGRITAWSRRRHNLAFLRDQTGPV